MTMKHIIRGLLALLAAGVLSASPAIAEEPGAFPLFLVVQDITARDINGEFRFCESKKLENGVCYQSVNWFGKKRRMPQDWWTAETYVYAVTGRGATIVNLVPTQDGRGIIIYYQ